MARTPCAPKPRRYHSGKKSLPARKHKKPAAMPPHYVDGLPVPVHMLMVTKEAMCLYDAHKACKIFQAAREAAERDGWLEDFDKQLTINNFPGLMLPEYVKTVHEERGLDIPNFDDIWVNKTMEISALHDSTLRAQARRNVVRHLSCNLTWKAVNVDRVHNTKGIRQIHRDAGFSGLEIKSNLYTYFEKFMASWLLEQAAHDSVSFTKASIVQKAREIAVNKKLEAKFTVDVFDNLLYSLEPGQKGYEEKKFLLARINKLQVKAAARQVEMAAERTARLEAETKAAAEQEARLAAEAKTSDVEKSLSDCSAELETTRKTLSDTQDTLQQVQQENNDLRQVMARLQEYLDSLASREGNRYEKLGSLVKAIAMDAHRAERIRQTALKQETRLVASQTITRVTNVLSRIQGKLSDKLDSTDDWDEKSWRDMVKVIMNTLETKAINPLLQPGIAKAGPSC